ncbi:MAG: hypothetical protein JWL96_1202 [Sphingomonas bacterium]|uniref:hypothetical protein n=1 Tax=Sphingomonas bacterium TaxID=1895847 RepID=UPI002604E87B|nr:hypothetical protein [Sphingomonas bacterium]MDB5709132.1 hypothetical protein [Sphingomonas bacterium]
MGVLYVLISMAMGSLFDWALYGRIVSALGMPDIYTTGYGYRDFLFPRIFVTLSATVVMFFCVGENSRVVPFILAAAVCFLSTCYGAYRYLRGDELRR